MWVLICTVHLTACSYHVTCAFQSEFTLYSFLNVRELLAPLAKSLSVHSQTKWLWASVLLQSLEFLILRVSSKDFLNIQTTIECRSTLKCVRDMIRAYNPWLLVFQFNFSFWSFSFTLWIWNTFCCIVSLCIGSKSVSDLQLLTFNNFVLQFMVSFLSYIFK